MRILKTVFITALLVSCSSDDSGIGGGSNFLGEVESIRTFGGTKNEEVQRGPEFTEERRSDTWKPY